MGSYMSWIDWLIVIIPVAFVMYIGYYSRRYVHGVSDFLSAGRVCGRYVINMGDAAHALSIIALLTYIEIKYQTGFALTFWNNIMAPLTLVLSLTGFVTYRFRETKAMSLGQFLEMRYSRKFRIFAAALRSLAEMLANMIMPSLAARFFIRMLNLPDHFPFLGMSIPTFEFLMIFFLTLAILLICFGGTLSIIVTDTIQGLVLYPLLVCFVIFILYKFSWSKEIIPVVQDRVAGESFLDPFDIAKLRDFNIFTMVIVLAFNHLFHRPSWIGGGSTTAAKSAHEQKMASILSSWRYALINVFYMLVAICLITFLNHRHFSKEAAQVRHDLALRVASDVLKDAKYADTLAAVKDTIDKIPPLEHTPGVDAPLSQEHNLDTEYMAYIHETLTTDRVSAKKAQLAAQQAGADLSDVELEANKKAIIDAEGEANDLFKQCRTLFTQMSLSVTMRHLLPTGLFGAFCLLLFMAMLSTDDTRIFSSALTIAQDCILPFMPKALTPKQHIWMIRWVSIGVGVFFFFGSKYMSQLDYIQFFIQMATAMWLAGCCSVLMGGLYWKKGTTQAAWTALVTGMLMSLIYILLQRNWASHVYPFIEKVNMVEFCDKLLRTLSAPFGTWIVWKMHPVNFPVNSVEFTFFANIFTIILYAIVSLCTCKKDFNMDRMLHRGKYADPNEHKDFTRDWSLKGIWKTVIGITPEYSKSDRIISYALFAHTFIYGFLITFVGVAIYNVYRISRGMDGCSVQWWGTYFFITQLLVPGIISAITAVWFGIGGFIGIIDLFKTLEQRKNLNELDNGRVEGNVSLGDTIAQADEEKSESK